MENGEILEKLVEEFNEYSMAYKFYLELGCTEQKEQYRHKLDVVRDLIYKWFGKNSINADYVPAEIFGVDFRWCKMEVR